MNDDSGTDEIRGLVASFVQMMVHVRTYLEDAEAKAEARTGDLEAEEAQIHARLLEIALERQDIQELRATCAARLADLEAQRQALIAKMGGAVSLLDPELSGLLGVPDNQRPAVSGPDSKPLKAFKPPSSARVLTFQAPGPTGAARPDSRTSRPKAARRPERQAIELILADGARWTTRDIMKRYKELLAAPPRELEGLELPGGGAQSDFIALLRKVPGIKSDGSRSWWL